MFRLIAKRLVVNLTFFVGIALLYRSGLVVATACLVGGVEHENIGFSDLFHASLHLVVCSVSHYLCPSFRPVW